MAKRAKWFEKQISQYLLECATSTGRSNGLIRGSSVGLKCTRRIGYMVLGYGESPTSAHQQYVLAFGNAMHDMVQTWMSRMGLVNATPYLAKDKTLQWKGDAEGTIVDPEDGIIGHYDGLTQPLLPMPEDMHLKVDAQGKRYLLEFKTITNKTRVHAVYYDIINGEGYTVKYLIPSGMDLHDANLPRLEGSPPKHLYSKGNEKYLAMIEALEAPDSEGNIHKVPAGTFLSVLHKPGYFSDMTKPKDEHVEQATYYASRLKADAILIVYLAKDFDESTYDVDDIHNIPIKAFELDVKDKVVQGIKQKAATLWAYLESGSEAGGDPETWLPPRPFTPEESFSECKFCPYAYTCYPNSQSVLQRTAERFKQQAMANLTVSTGKPFEKHSAERWGRDAARSGLIKDEHGQKNAVYSAN